MSAPAVVPPATRTGAELRDRPAPPHAAAPRRWYAVRLVLVYAIWIACFEAVGRYASTLQTTDLTSALDRAIPFVPAWVWAYELCYVFPFVPLVAVRDDARFSRALLAIVLANVSAFAVYLALPIAWPLSDPGPTLAGHVLALEQAADFHPGANKLPSMHVAFAWIVFLACRRQRSRAWDAAVLTTAATVSVSTLLVKQHIVVDVVAGVAWAFGAWWAAGRLGHGVHGECADARTAFRRVAVRAGIPAVLATAALVAIREAARRLAMP